MRLRRTLAITVGLLAFGLYAFTVAPGLTWAYFGADGGELLAAAVTNGVPHPPGYPLYIMLLQAWLALVGFCFAGSDLAWRGNLLSALFAAASVSVTFLTCERLLHWLEQQGVLTEGTDKSEQTNRNLFWSLLAALAWMIGPLLWSQALITEVYALHVLLVSILGWATFLFWQEWRAAQGQGVVMPGDAHRHLLILALVTALGVAHHLTFVLLLPAVLYAGWSAPQVRAKRLPLLFSLAAILAIGGMLGLLFHLRTWLAAQNGAPVNWGDARAWEGLWWLISGQAYRSYLFSASSAITFDRIAAWAYTLTMQFTPIGLALLLFGLSHLDRLVPTLRNFCLLWLAPTSVYAIVYFTKDTEIYLLPVVWLTVLLLAIGLTIADNWFLRYTLQRNLAFQNGHQSKVLPVLLGSAILILMVWRISWISLRHDDEARRFLREVAQVVQPQSIVVSTSDERTFALWYGAWASQELPEGLVLVNDYLYQFAWYQRNLAHYYPETPAASVGVDPLIATYRGVRPIFFADGPLADTSVYANQTVPNGPLFELR